MKRFLFVVILSLLSIASFAHCIGDSKTTTPDKQTIIIKKTFVSNGNQRSLFGEIKAYACFQTGTIEVELYDTGETNIYIVNANNDVIDECTVDSDFTQSATLLLPIEKGRYYIVIDSPILYGEGTFLIK